eukprot:scaffold6439_cov167-Amphora_coffeaeformis.AAC.13
MDLTSIPKAPSFNEKAVYRNMLQDLGKDRMDRFGPVRRPLDVKQRLLASPADLEAFILLIFQMEVAHLDTVFSQEQILRVAMFHKFDVDKCFRLLKHMDIKFWNISAEQLEAQLLTHTLFPLPKKLTSKDSKIKSFFYMKPSRFSPTDTPTSAIIANLLYVMDSMDRFTDPSNTSKNKSRNTIGFIANMNGWTMKNFTVEYCLQFMEALQGKKGPVQVDLFLIVNPPSWFGKVWAIMKPMLSTKFRTKVHMIHQDKLDRHLAAGYEQYLPQELVSNGQVDVASHVNDYIRYRKYVEAEVFPHERQPTKTTQRLVQLKKSVDGGVPSRRASLDSNKVDVAAPKCLRPLRRENLGRMHSLAKLESTDLTGQSASDMSDGSDVA